MQTKACLSPCQALSVLSFRASWVDSQCDCLLLKMHNRIFQCSVYACLFTQQCQQGMKCHCCSLCLSYMLGVLPVTNDKQRPCTFLGLSSSVEKKEKKRWNTLLTAIGEISQEWWGSQDPTMVEVGREPWKSPGPRLLLKQGHLEQAAQAVSWQLLSIFQMRHSTLIVLSCLLHLQSWLLPKLLS